MKRYVSFDPGVATGVAQAFVHDGAIVKHQAFELDQFPVSRMALEYAIDRDGIDEVEFICETFTINQQTLRKTRQTASLEIIGVIKLAAHEAGITLAMQSPGDAKRFATDARLKKSGLWTSTKGGHANDANRHLFLRLVKHGVLSPTEVDQREG